MIARFTGLQYPLIKTPRGLLAQSRDVVQIKADILQLLLTNPGERVMLPTYGTPLRRLVFEPNDLTLRLRAKQMIEDAIAAWEPRVVIQNIEVSSQVDISDLDRRDPGEDIENILSVKVEFLDPNDIAQVNELIIELPIGTLPGTANTNVSGGRTVSSTGEVTTNISNNGG